MRDLDLQIVFTGFWTHLYLFDLKGALFLLGFLFLFGLLVTVPAVIHNLAHRRVGVRRNLNQVQPKFGGRVQGLAGRNNTDLLPVRVDNSNLPGPDILVDVDAIGSNWPMGSSWCSYVLPPIAMILALSAAKIAVGFSGLARYLKKSPGSFSLTLRR